MDISSKNVHHKPLTDNEQTSTACTTKYIAKVILTIHMQPMALTMCNYLHAFST